jgi:hypothetical protein
MESYLEPFDISERQGKEIEEERPFGFCCKGDEFSLLIRVRPFVDKLEIGGLAAETRPIIDDLYIYFTGRIINKRH